jgi:hypothetical protein
VSEFSFSVGMVKCARCDHEYGPLGLRDGLCIGCLAAELREAWHDYAASIAANGDRFAELSYAITGVREALTWEQLTATARLVKQDAYGMKNVVSSLKMQRGIAEEKADRLEKEARHLRLQRGHPDGQN